MYNLSFDPKQHTDTLGTDYKDKKWLLVLPPLQYCFLGVIFLNRQLKQTYFMCGVRKYFFLSFFLSFFPLMNRKDFFIIKGCCKKKKKRICIEGTKKLWSNLYQCTLSIYNLHVHKCQKFIWIGTLTKFVESKFRLYYCCTKRSLSLINTTCQVCS